MLCISTWKRCYCIGLWINIIMCIRCRGEKKDQYYVFSLLKNVLVLLKKYNSVLWIRSSEFCARTKFEQISIFDKIKFEIEKWRRHWFVDLITQIWRCLRILILVCKFLYCWLLCISTSFRVPECWSKYFFSAVFNLFCWFQNFSVISQLKSTRLKTAENG